MSFERICTGCGAPSGPSVGLCPFCKTIMTSQKEKKFEQENSLIKIYDSGRLDLALTLAKKIYTDLANPKQDAGFLFIFAKILLDTEAPSSLVKSVLAEAHLADPNNQDVLDCLELIEAKGCLKKGLNDTGEERLKKLILRSPKNVQAYFLLGTHLFWEEQHPELAISHLETCVRLSPNFLRAWGCLGAIYKQMGNPQLSIRAFQRCVELEQNPKMKEYFQNEISKQK